MQSRKFNIIALVVALSMILSACSSAAANTGTPAAPAAATGAATTAAQPAEMAPGSVQINGAGATFPLPLYTEWTYDYQAIDPAVALNYQGIGSGGGKKAIIDGTVDFAGSDSLLNEDEYARGKDLQMLPVVAGAVVPIYNIKWNASAPTSPLVLDGKTLVGIYNGSIKKWNDPSILTLNPTLKDALPDGNITVVHRSDGSGTTELFTKALTSFSPDWKAGGASAVEWPADKAGNGVGGKGNPGVAAAVTNTPNSIGYVELSYALANKIATASLVNKAGKKVIANGESIQAAMSDFATQFTDKLTNTIVDAPGEKSWPIAGYTYLILHMKSVTDCTKAQKLAEYIKWTLTDSGAAKKATDLGYSVLPAEVQKTVLAKLSEFSCNGSPALK
jgi:phosphate transport system substrate-binding protein